MFQGSPKMALNASNLQNNPPIIQSTIQKSIDKEIADLKDKTDKFKYYPVLSVGLAYKF